MLNLKHGQDVLDVGCGIGGSAFYMVKVIILYKIHIYKTTLSETFPI